MTALTALALIPVVLSLLLLAAHLLRGGHILLIVVVAMLVGLLAVRRPWAARVVQVGLLLGALEWVRTLVALSSSRVAAGQPATRLVLILGAVTAITALSALLFETGPLRRFYRRASSGPARVD